jgi:DNA excision repair protein ERCC-2
MSATISPLDVYSESVGVDELQRPVMKEQFGLRFPESNRGSYIVPLDQFIKGNRGKTTESNDTRRKYKQAIVDIIDNAEGNILVCMPSYKEAKWIHDAVEDTIDNPLYLDESSSNDETMALKSAFETQDDGVLFTGLRGTLTEGVDYDGDKLSNVIVVGVPLTYPYSNKAQAIQTAYAVNFGRANAFDYSHTVPAIYKTRQALGRVIRSTDDVGTRIILDERYTADHNRSAAEFLTDQEQDEFETVAATDIGDKIKTFWKGKQI